MKRRAIRAVAKYLCLMLMLATVAHGQDVLEVVEELDFDRPEAWALKYFTSVSLLTGLGPPQSRKAGSVDLGLELGWVPHLDEEQRRVGFNGTKEEDLNKVSAFARLRVTFGLGRKFSITAGWVPPIQVNGVESNLLSLAIERPVYDSDRWTTGLRLFGQVGDSEGDLVCPEELLAFEPGSEGNPFGCEAKSRDVSTLRYVGLELSSSHRFSSKGAPSVYAALAVSHMDLEFQVDALTFGFIDRTRQLADGVTYSLTAGATWALPRKTHLGVEVFYSPLTVERPGDTSSDNDPLLNARVMVGYRVR